MTKFNTYEEIYEIVEESLVNVFEKDRGSIFPDSDFKEDLNLDSLDKVNLLIELEDIYGKELVTDENEEDEQRFYTVKTPHELTSLVLEIVNKLNKGENSE